MCIYYSIFIFVSMDTLEYVIIHHVWTSGDKFRRQVPPEVLLAGPPPPEVVTWRWVMYPNVWGISPYFTTEYAFFRAEELKGTCLHIYIYTYIHIYIYIYIYIYTYIYIYIL